MFLNKTRVFVITLLTWAGLAAAAVAPSASQAQWHTICYGGHCTTHTNYTIAGQDPCTAISGQYNTDYGAYLDALANQQQQAVMVHPTESPAQTQADVDAAEAQVAADQRAAFMWGCSLS